MSDERPFASILVRAHNDAAFIERTLAGIFAQKVDFPFEVVVCDDASTDGTRAIAARFPVRFFERPSGAYKPGRTLNALVGAAAGEVVVFNNADAVPRDENWLAALVKPLRDAPETPAFTFANQLPRADAQALVRKDNERAFGDGKVQATWRFFFSVASAAKSSTAPGRMWSIPTTTRCRNWRADSAERARPTGRSSGMRRASCVRSLGRGARRCATGRILRRARRTGLRYFPRRFGVSSSASPTGAACVIW